MKNSLFSKLTPKEPKFFPLLNNLSDTLLETATLLEESISHHTSQEREEYYKRIKDLERQGDSFNHSINDELATTFITPFDREDINRLSASIDDVIDRINGTAKRIYLYNPQPIGAAGVELTKIIKECALHIVDAVSKLENIHGNAKEIRTSCRTLHNLENQADDIYEKFVQNLFVNEKDFAELIKSKEIMQGLEKATDGADFVGKVLKSMVVKYI